MPFRVFFWVWGLVAVLLAGLLILVGPVAAQQPAVPPAPVPVAPVPGGAAATPPVGQQAELVLGRTTFPINEYFTIALRLRGAPLERYSAFPDIEGFKKSGKSSTTTTRIVGGRATVELLLTQRYAAFAEGDFELKPFSLTVNGQVVRSVGATLHVGAQVAPAAPSAAAKPPLQGIGSLDQLFGKPKPQDYIEPRDNAFLALVPDKARVWVGEPLHVGLYFYLAPADQGLLDFHRFAEQLPALLRQLRQPSAWQETFDETDIVPDSVRVGGKPFLRYRLYEAVYYPLNARPLQFPELSLQMKKYRVAKSPVEGADNRLVGYKTYRSAARTVPVQPLPPNANAPAVAVGRYRLLEGIDRTTFRTGQSIGYTITLEGEGNLTALPLPTALVLPGLELFGPEVRQEITRQNGRVGGRKVLRYRLVARQPGTYRLDSLLAVPVFDPETGRYAALRPELVLTVQGRPVRPATEAAAFIRTDPFYAQHIPTADNTLQARDTPRQVRRYTYAVLGVLGMLAVLGWWRAGLPRG
ncbi:BatD family protein [Hymenobacter sp. B81]|uniref:BatD family protein n=1 Tax=Hymenobacter sp. B81 TaxID=3344878 RepID=UPI0037DCB8D2